MANIDLYKQKLVDIADAIRQQLSEIDTYKLEEMPDKILSIQGGGSSGIQIAQGIDKADTPKDLTKQTVLAFSSVSYANGYSPITVTKVSS